MKFAEDIACEYSNSKHGSMVDIHYHPWYELFYLISGRGTCFIDDKSYTLTSGDVMLVPPGLIHLTKYSSPSRSRLLINVLDLPHEVVCRALSKGYVIRNPELSHDVFQIMKNIEKEYLKPDALSKALMSAELCRLLVMLARGQNYYVDEKEHGKYIRAAIEYIHANFQSNITPSTVANSIHISREHLSRTFKNETGIELSKYITNLRIKHAEQFLKNSDKAIIQIAHLCGFNDSNYFSSVFKKSAGMSPTKFRKLHAFKNKH